MVIISSFYEIAVFRISKVYTLVKQDIQGEIQYDNRFLNYSKLHIVP